MSNSIMSIYHCMDNYIPGLLKVAAMSDIMGLFAPKPVVIVAGQDDDIHFVVGQGGHRFYAEDA